MRVSTSVQSPNVLENNAPLLLEVVAGWLRQRTNVTSWARIGKRPENLQIVWLPSFPIHPTKESLGEEKPLGLMLSFNYSDNCTCAVHLKRSLVCAIAKCSGCKNLRLETTQLDDDNDGSVPTVGVFRRCKHKPCAARQSPSWRNFSLSLKRDG